MANDSVMMGTLDEVHLLSKALTAEEVTAERMEDESAVVWLGF